MPQTLVHHRFTVDEYEQMIDFGILNENDRVELIRGEILDKMPIGDRHCACVKRLNLRLTVGVGGRALIGIQDPVRFDDSEPEPDVSVLRPQLDFYAAGKPRPADVLLLIGVADATLDHDREVKRALYAMAGIPEYWIVNLIDDNVEVYRRPQPDGTYADVQVLRAGQQVEIAALPGLILAVDEIL